MREQKPMSDERLAEMRENADAYKTPGEYMEDISDLLADNDRLRAALAEAERYRDAVAAVLGSHRCGEQAERAYKRAAIAEADLAKVRLDRDKAEAALARVDALHKPHIDGNGRTVCLRCDDAYESGRLVALPHGSRDWRRRR